MNLSCHVIQDLLPLYHDGVCSPESAAMIEAHLQNCEACQEAYHQLQQAPLSISTSTKEEEKAEDLKKIRQTLRKKWVKVASIAVVVMLVLSVTAWFAMNLRFLAASPDVLESLSVEGTTLNVTLKKDAWVSWINTDSGYVEEEGELVPILLLSSSTSPSDYLWQKLHPKAAQEAAKSFAIDLEQNYTLFFLSQDAYRQAFEDLGYDFSTDPGEEALEKIDKRAEEILAEEVPQDQGYQRIYFYDGCTVTGLYNLDMDWEDIVANLNQHGTLLWTAEDGVVYQP